MIRIILFLAIVMLMPQMTYSQREQEAERIAAYRIAFFTRRLDLTPGEAEKFWPVYNDYESRKNKLQQERAVLLRYINQNESNMSDEELLKSADRLVAFQGEEAALTLELHGKLKTILPPVKVLRVYQTEQMFRNQLLNDLRNVRRGNEPIRDRPYMPRQLLNRLHQ
jgi:hypothetical protein